VWKFQLAHQHSLYFPVTAKEARFAEAALAALKT